MKTTEGKRATAIAKKKNAEKSKEKKKCLLKMLKMSNICFGFTAKLSIT